MHVNWWQPGPVVGEDGRHCHFRSYRSSAKLRLQTLLAWCHGAFRLECRLAVHHDQRRCAKKMVDYFEGARRRAHFIVGALHG